jgi:WD40 repeat protein
MPQPCTTPDIEAFLDHLQRAGYGIGTRERLLAYRLLTELAVRDELPDNAAASLRLLAPLLSRDASEQKRFAALIEEFLAVRQNPAAAIRWRGLFDLTSPAARHVWFVAAAAIFTLILIGVLDHYRATPRVAGPQVETTSTAPAPSEQLEPPQQSPYIPAGTFEAPAAEIAPPRAEDVVWFQRLRWMLAAFAALLAGGVIAVLLRRSISSIYLQNVRTADEVEKRMLYDRAGLPNVVADARIRAISRLLRQRIAGTRQILDPLETLRATMRAGGALMARYRRLRQTTEYLVLVDRRSRNDHQASLQEFLFQSLRKSGVHVDLFTFDRSPANGCRRAEVAGEPLDAQQQRDAAAPLAVAQLANRYGGHRLLLFCDAAVAFDQISGAAAPWTRHVAGFAQRVWLSPLPVASWSRAESQLRALGFVVMPGWPAAIEAVAEWLLSDRVTLRPEADWPGAYPASLRGEENAWVARQVRPPEAVEQRLLFELRFYLQSERFQWLCACAAFPVLSWPLTIALGQQVLAASKEDQPRGNEEDRPREEKEDESRGEMGLGFTVLAVLPWFRHGTMPAWLRESLLDRLDPAQVERVRTLLNQRLGAALAEGQGAAITEVATRRRIRGWFQRRKDRITQDVILADFLERGVTPRLAQRLPDPLRRLLFKGGRPLYGLRDVVLATAAVAAAAIIVLITPTPWEAIVGRWFVLETLVPLRPLLGLRGHQAGVNSASFSPDGRYVVTASDDGTARVWRADGVGDPIMLSGHEARVTNATFSPDGLLVLTASDDGTARVWDVSRGERLVTLALSGPVRTASFSQNGEFVLTASANAAVSMWYWRRGVVLWRLSSPEDFPSSVVAASAGGRFILTTEGERGVHILDAADGRRLLTLDGHVEPVSCATLSRDGTRVLTASVDGTMRIWSTSTGAIEVTEDVGGAAVYCAFSPDGRATLAVTASGNVFVSRPPAPPVVLIAGERPFNLVSAAFAPNNNQVVTATANAVSVWDLGGGGEVATLPVAGGLRSATFSPDGQQVVTTSEDGVVRVWGRPTTSVAIAACGTAVDDGNARRLARDLIGPISTELGHRFSPTVYPQLHWHRDRLGEPPPPGAVHYHSDAEEKGAAAARLTTHLFNASALGREQWLSEAGRPSSADISIGICTIASAADSTPVRPQADVPRPVAPGAQPGVEQPPSSSQDGGASPRASVPDFDTPRAQSGELPGTIVQPDFSFEAAPPREAPGSVPAATLAPRQSTPLTDVSGAVCRPIVNPAELLFSRGRQQGDTLYFTVAYRDVDTRQRQAMQLALRMWNAHSETTGFAFEESNEIRKADVLLSSRRQASSRTTACVAYEPAGSLIRYVDRLMSWVEPGGDIRAARVYAHQLGHALGLMHLPGDSVMREGPESERSCREVATTLPDITASDALRARECNRRIREDMRQYMLREGR